MMTFPRATPAIAWALCSAFLLFPSLSLAESGPLSPGEGETVGTRPWIVWLYTDLKSSMRFSIEISNDQFEDDIQTWDMRRSMRGWGLYVDSPDAETASGGKFMPPLELAEGTWWWRVTAHDGAADIPLDFVSSFRVDSTPPAEVEGLTIGFEGESPGPTLRWDPVFLDMEGRPETVREYKIYRYHRRGLFAVGGNLQVVGRTDRETFTEENAGWSTSPIAYYMVTAVDEVGNETVPRRGDRWVARPRKPTHEYKTRSPEERRRKRRAPSRSGGAGPEGADR